LAPDQADEKQAEYENAELPMSKDAVDSRWMDERAPEVQPGLTCHVELDLEKGNTFRELLAKVAWGLRTTALQVEAGKLTDGIHPITTLDGEVIGKVDIDYHGTM
jgi:hypothetical protein